jgi:putative SOS response-associated peptidase YedK
MRRLFVSAVGIILPLRMCGRFYLTASGAEIRKKFKLDEVHDLLPRYNIAPTQLSAIVIAQGRDRRFRMARWGLVPSWSRDLSMGDRMINAPAETIEDRPAFRTPFHARRCLVPASGYYEWQTKGTRKQPYKITLRSSGSFAFAGLWDRWTPETGEPVETFAIITTRASKLISEVNERMPVIVAPADYQRWLSAPEQTARKLLLPYTGGMTIAPVSDRINNTKDDDVGLIAPVH